ncbi:hypothetical protein GCK72_009999 [Caenorhabditis remanei]|uniref:Uncharacterized protein n=1 Tax=Caenorhabditis remanei TaxID=31234 RepID=A0A6A5H5E6_CAERE|nr:hypothetical protein GCK72_009999 [Caenorhabditis remanei]KAF1761743.1 hypothetical protein GCK72_009999 [Caenorhabditis remanei]
MGAEVPTLIVCLSISLCFNIGFIIFLFIKRRSRNSPQYRKVENPDVESFPKNSSSFGTNPQRSPEKEKDIKDPPLKPIVNAKRSSEQAIRSDQGAPIVKEPQQRSDRQRLQEPIGREEFVKCMNSVVQFINEYFDESHKQPVIPEHDINSTRIHVKVPEKPEEFSEILKDLKEIVIPNICHTHHPRYHAKFAGKSLADIVGSTVSAALGHDVNSSPIIDSIERIICKWLSSAMAIPQMKSWLNELREPIGAVFYTPRDVFISIIRHSIEKAEKTDESSPKSDKEQKPKFSDYVVYCSDDSQIALEEACSTMKVRLRKVITFNKDSSAMTSANLLKQMEKDKARGLIPLVIVANYGSANVAANDEIWDLVKISRKKKIWLHLDATYAGCEWLDSNCRNNIHALISELHSVHIACSSLFPYSGRISVVWSCERLDIEGAKTHYGEHPIRLWILIRLYGIRSIREAVKRKIILGNAFSERLTHHPEFFEMSHQNDHGVAVFQYRNKNVKDQKRDVNRMTSMFHNYLILSSTLKFSLLSYHGKVMIKAVVNYGRCNLSIMEESVSTLLNSVEEFEEALSKLK